MHAFREHSSDKSYAMRAPPPAIGTRLADLLTPSLLVSLPVLERNEAACRSYLRGTGVALRPHAKAHKSSGLAEWLLDRGGSEITGLCAQTVSEATVMVEKGGCKNLLLTNEVVSSAQIRRLATLAADNPDATIGVLVDSPDNVLALSDAMASVRGGSLSAFVEIDCGQDRCGVKPASPAALAVAQAVVEAPGLEFGGLHVYHGGIQHVRETEDRRAAVASGPASAAKATVSQFRAAGIEVPVVTGAGTGTFKMEVEAGEHNEVQPGSYLFMDGDYSSNQEGTSAFAQSLFVHTTVISADEAGGKRVVDAGTKAVDLLCGAPRLATVDDEAAPLDPELLQAVSCHNGGDEHGVLRGVPAGQLPLGSTVQLAPSHCDPTVNLHDYLIGVRGGVVECCWPIDARGPN
tara:strand:- start:500 stop:1714 length:1215 start_codon:yes stop_codon:yes gene_type:complete